jgi:pyocin large subunit-like protein
VEKPDGIPGTRRRPTGSCALCYDCAVMSTPVSRRPVWSVGRLLVAILALSLLVASAGCGSATSAASGPAATPAAATRQKNAPPAGAGGGGSAAAGQAAAKDGGARTAADVDRERIAASATWAPGQLESHFEKHGREGDHRSAAQYDASARETIRTGTAFTYRDRESNAERLGFYDKSGNRFTGVTRDGRRITTHFRPDRGEAYVRNLEASTYR